MNHVFDDGRTLRLGDTRQPGAHVEATELASGEQLGLTFDHAGRDPRAVDFEREMGQAASDGQVLPTNPVEPPRAEPPMIGRQP